jgi:predicted PurR-regulated permease PerM
VVTILVQRSFPLLTIFAERLFFEAETQGQSSGTFLSVSQVVDVRFFLFFFVFFGTLDKRRRADKIMEPTRRSDTPSSLREKRTVSRFFGTVVGTVGVIAQRDLTFAAPVTHGGLKRAFFSLLVQTLFRNGKKKQFWNTTANVFSGKFIPCCFLGFLFFFVFYLPEREEKKGNDVQNALKKKTRFFEQRKR